MKQCFSRGRSRAALSGLRVPHRTKDRQLAVVELVEDLRDLIWSHYGAHLRDEYREQYGRLLPIDTPPDDPEDLSF